MEEVVLADEEARWQRLQHFCSSLEEMTLENVQARQEAIRKRNLMLSLELQRSGYSAPEEYVRMVGKQVPEDVFEHVIISTLKSSSKENPWAD
jgi:hypothetical protein